jgi:hypothetical protein
VLEKIETLTGAEQRKDLGERRKERGKAVGFGSDLSELICPT